MKQESSQNQPIIRRSSNISILWFGVVQIKFTGSLSDTVGVHLRFVFPRRPQAKNALVASSIQVRKNIFIRWVENAMSFLKFVQIKANEGHTKSTYVFLQ